MLIAVRRQRRTLVIGTSQESGITEHEVGMPLENGNSIWRELAAYN